MTYTLSGTDAASFTISSASETAGQISVGSGVKLDYETKKTYKVTVTATDPDGLSASIDVTITVTDMDEAPDIDGDDVTKDYPENGKAQVARFTAKDPEKRKVYWSVLPTAATGDIAGVETADAEDAGDFMINSDGVLTFKFSPDFESPNGGSGNDSNAYKVVVVASDDGMGVPDRMMGYKKVTVTVTDVDEPGVITLSAQQPQVAQVLTATLNDPEDGGDPTDLVWEWKHSSSRSGGSVIAGATTNSYTPVVGVVVNKYLRVEATYKDSRGNEKKAMAASAKRVREAPASNIAPVATEATKFIDENSAPGTKVGEPFTATDTPGDVLTYTLGWNRRR